MFISISFIVCIGAALTAADPAVSNTKPGTDLASSYIYQVLSLIRGCQFSCSEDKFEAIKHAVHNETINYAWKATDNQEPAFHPGQLVWKAFYGVKSGWTALHMAATTGFAEIIDYLVAAGANVNSVDKFGNTPLHFAAKDELDRTAAAEALIKHGADVNIANNAGEKPLQLAVESGHESLVKLFQSHGAN